MFRSRHCGISLLVLGALSACSTRMHSPDSLSQDASTTAQKSQAATANVPHKSGGGGMFVAGSPEMVAETEVSEKSLQAWRLALKGDEKNSMAILDALDKKYPKMKTVAFMKGQCLDRLGKKKEAVAYYQAAVTGDDFDQMKIYKLAEATRTAGDSKNAVRLFRQLIEHAPDFAPAHIGLAKSLLAQNKNSAEAKQELKTALSDDPNSTEARALIETLKTGKSTEPDADKK